ncbi:hypothetical protein ACHQM5_018734 [Ranunculus cassubicifolius]
MKKSEDEEFDETMRIRRKDHQKAKQKPQFRPAEDDTKPVLRDPILRSDPIETEEVFLRLPPFPPVSRS